MEAFSALKMEPAGFSEMPVHIHQTMHSYFPEDNDIILGLRLIQIPLTHTLVPHELRKTNVHVTNGVAFLYGIYAINTQSKLIPTYRIITVIMYSQSCEWYLAGS
jgi:hypothetical protein